MCTNREGGKQILCKAIINSSMIFNTTGNDAIDLTDYSRLPNGLVSMFASFSSASAHKGYFLTFNLCTNLTVVELKLNYKLILLTLLCTKW